MSTLKITERVTIKAPVERVFAFLIDPERVVQCLPGATYDGKESDTVFLGHIKVKVGPVSTLFAGKATMAEVDAAAHTVHIVGEGKDKNGAGNARMEMRGAVHAIADGAELAVDADVDISGKLVTFGRGLIQSVSAQLFKQFAERARAALEVEPAASPAASPATDAAAASAPVAVPVPALVPARAPVEEASINGLSLLFRAIGSSIAGLFRRLFRRGRNPTR
jgi:carbon monoxide dehydrogenase subunit G